MIRSHACKEIKLNCYKDAELFSINCKSSHPFFLNFGRVLPDLGRHFLVFLYYYTKMRKRKMKAVSSSLHVKVAGKEKADDGEDSVSCEEGIKVHRPQHCRSLRMPVIDEDNDADHNLLLKRSGFQKGADGDR